MLSQPYIPKPQELMFASLTLGVPIKEVLKESSKRIVYLSPNQFNTLYSRLSIRQYVFNHPNIRAGIYALEDKIMIVERSFEDSYKIMAYNVPAIACAYMLKKHKIEDVLDRGYPLVSRKLSIHFKNMYKMRDAYNSLARAHDNFEYTMSEISLDTSELDIDYELKIIKGLKRKYGITGELTSEHIILVFKNLEVGNDVEGYISYKRLDVRIDRMSLKINSIRFEFANGFVMDTSWGFGFYHLHPHISGDGSVCYGNQGTLASAYIKQMNLELYIDVLVETLSGYNAGDDGHNPYTSVSNIRRTLSSVESLFSGLEDVSDQRRIAQQIYIAVREGRRTLRTMGTAVHSLAGGTCHACQRELELSNVLGGYICRNNQCNASVRYEQTIQCPSCHEPMSRIWNYQQLEWTYNCINETCLRGPIRLYEDGSVRCPSCGNNLMPDEDGQYYCECDEEESIFISSDRIITTPLDRLSYDDTELEFRRQDGSVLLLPIPPTVTSQTIAPEDEVGHQENTDIPDEERPF